MRTPGLEGLKCEIREDGGCSAKGTAVPVGVLLLHVARKWAGGSLPVCKEWAHFPARTVRWCPGLGAHAALQAAPRTWALSSGLMLITLLSLKRQRGSKRQARQGISPSNEASSGHTYGFAALANHPASCGGGHSDVRFQLHLFFGVKEVFFFQFPKDPPLGLRQQDTTVTLPAASHLPQHCCAWSPEPASAHPASLPRARHGAAVRPTSAGAQPGGAAPATAGECAVQSVHGHLR